MRLNEAPRGSRDIARQCERDWGSHEVWTTEVLIGWSHAGKPVFLAALTSAGQELWRVFFDAASKKNGPKRRAERKSRVKKAGGQLGML